MKAAAWPVEFHVCEDEWKANGFVSLATIFSAAVGLATGSGALAGANQVDQIARHLCRAFNTAPAAWAAIRSARPQDHSDAANLLAWMQVQGLAAAPAQPLSWGQASMLERDLLADHNGFLAQDVQPYPLSISDRHFGLDVRWIRERLALGRDRYARFCAVRENDTAVLVGNGPSLNETDLSLLQGQDVFISNYAIRNDELRGYAKGVAVTNYLVAEQEPYVFQFDDVWKFHPVWMGHVLEDSDQTAWMPALGGDLFFGTDPSRSIAWHATVTYFWLQVLYGAGYKRVLLIGVDNDYQQGAELKEGDLVVQEENDLNHFDPAYFRGKIWQAADTGHMAQTYAKAREIYESSDRTIINCSAGGKLDVFPRSTLEQMV